MALAEVLSRENPLVLQIWHLEELREVVLMVGGVTRIVVEPLVLLLNRVLVVHLLVEFLGDYLGIVIGLWLIGYSAVDLVLVEDFVLLNGLH